MTSHRDVQLTGYGMTRKLKQDNILVASLGSFASRR